MIASNKPRVNPDRVAIFIPSLNGGGAERVMVTLANAFAIRGFEIDLLLAAAHGHYLRDVSPAVQIVDLKSARVIKSLLPLIRYLRRVRPVVMLSAMTHANVVALLARMLAHVPTRLVVSERTTISIEANRAQNVTGRMVNSAAPVLYGHADAIVTVSKAAAADFVRFFNFSATAVETIYNPFDLSRIQAQAAESINHPWFAPGQPPVVLAVGRLNQAKDYPTLIRAFSRLRSEGRSIRLMILGEGELRDTLEALATACGLTREDVQMPGFVSNPFSYLARCGAFVLSSHYEGLPGALIEAMACGAPVVSTDCPSGPREILEGGRWGKLVPVGDVAALAKAIDTTLITPRAQLPDVRRRSMDFDLEPAVDAYLKVLGLPLRPRTDAASNHARTVS